MPPSLTDNDSSYTHTNPHLLHLFSYSRFLSEFAPDKSFTHCGIPTLTIVGTKQTDGRTKGRSATIHLSDTSVLWPLGGKPAIMRARCWCFALCRDSGVQCMLFGLHLNANCTTWKINCSRHNRCIFLCWTSYKVAHTPAGPCDLQPRLSERLSKPLSKTLAPPAEKFQQQSQLLAIVQQNTWSTMGVPTLPSHTKKRHSGMPSKPPILRFAKIENFMFSLAKCIRQNMCRTDLGSFRFWFDVNRSAFDEDMRKNDCYIFISSDLDLWLLDLKFAPIVTLVQRCPLN